MTRHRARPSFTVEIKRSRTSPLPDGERPQSERPASKPPAGFSKPPAGLPNPAAGLFKAPAGPSKLSANAPAPSEPESRPPSPGRNLWAGTGLLEEAAAATQSGRFDPPDLPIFGKAPADKVAADKDAAPQATAKQAAAKQSTAKRVLPSLIAPPEPEPEPEVAPEPEPKLPRVRRYRAAEPAPRRTAGPRPAFVWPEDWPDEAPIQTPAPITVPPRSQDRIELPKTEAAPQASDDGETRDGENRAGEIRPRVKRRAGDEDLRIGQRWKRRLPRVCW
ncbi:hypothetical protein DA075_07110 [Methylobacterium currus]|uniref:Uncharacterized protein n=1 Tax=Methylobacterium currus TaxID=2051553 RepID=A0A2R4WGQ9_9HYPH|nr:hypothetical protein [Methylobacterium currus]AWB20718.1 hypothetical protein DA075_07110 [Methylobacterium currus]